MTSTQTTNVLIIGAGPGGYPAAFHAADRGMQVTLVDPEEHPGGVCLYRGCVPSKALLHVANFLHEVEQASAWGITLGKPDIDAQGVGAWKSQVVKKLTGGLGQLCKTRGIEYVRGAAELQDGRHAEVSPADGEAYGIEFEHAIIATGSEPIILPGVPDSDRVMTARRALDVKEIPERLLVIGGGYIGLELGQVYAALGSAVTLVEMLPEILPGADRDLVRFLKKRLDDQFEAIRTETQAAEIKETDTGIEVRFEGAHEKTETFDNVLMSVGRKPLTRGAGLENTGVEISEDGYIVVDEKRRTAEASIYAVGDVTGEPMLAHKATHEARVAVEAIAGEPAAFTPQAIPFVVFSDPEIAWCGLTEREAEEQTIKIRKASFPWAASGRAVTLGRTDGMTKLLCDPETGRILGMGIAGRNAGELLAEGVLAMEMGAVVGDLAQTIHTHPTLSETLMEAAQACEGRSTHFTKGK